MAIDALHEKQTEAATQGLQVNSVDQRQLLQDNTVFNAESQRKRDNAGNLPNLAIIEDSQVQEIRQHHIKRNETLSEIVAKEFNLHDWNSIQAKVAEVAALNNIADPDKIRDGQDLRLTNDSTRDSATVQNKFHSGNEQAPNNSTEGAVQNKLHTGGEQKLDTSRDKAPEHETGQNKPSDQSAPAPANKSEQNKASDQSAPTPENKSEQNKTSDQSSSTEKPRDKALREYIQEHDHLLEQASQKMTSAERDQFAASVRQFENRMPELAKAYEKQGMSTEDAQIRAFQEAQKTYEQIGRLLEAKDNPNLPVTQQQRITLAEQTIQHAANPTSIDQGQHRTCAVNSVETRTYTTNPSEAARMVADLATTGEYITTRDHVRVVLNKDDLRPDVEAAKSDKVDGSRDHASQLFQIGAVNVWYAGHEQNLRYEQRKIDPTLTPPDTGERIVDYSSNPPQIQRPGFFARLTGTREDKYNQPGLNNDQVVYVGDQIEGGKSKDWQLDSRNVKSIDDMEAKIKDAKEHGKLPLVVVVHTGNEPFYTDSGQGAAGGSGGWHALTITDYVAGPPAQVAVDNQWGLNADHLGQNKINLKDMYRALNPPEVAAAEMEKNLPTDGRSHDKEQQFEALEVARIKHAAGKMTDEELTQTIAREMSDMKTNGYDERTKTKIDQLLKSLPLGSQLDLLTTGKSDGIFSDANMAYHLSRIAHKVRQAFDDDSVPHSPERLKQIKQLTVRLNEMKSHLPEKEQRDLENYMTQWHKLQT